MIKGRQVALEARPEQLEDSTDSEVKPPVREASLDRGTIEKRCHADHRATHRTHESDKQHTAIRGRFVSQ